MTESEAAGFTTDPNQTVALGQVRPGDLRYSRIAGAVRTSSPHVDIGVIGEAALRLAGSVGDQLGVKTRVTSGVEAPLA
ncbi:hypothetical protein [Streptomyces sp. NPDC001056]